MFKLAFPTSDEPETLYAVYEAARTNYPDTTFDTSLPQHWVDSVVAAGFKHPYGNFVWAYPSNSLNGHPLPVTKEGFMFLCEMSACFRR